MNVNTKTRGLIVACAAGLSFSSACATARPPSELVEARAAYAESERSAAAQYDPASLHEAKVALEHAEQLYKEDDSAMRTRDAAYIAMRRAERAAVEGQTAKLNAETAEAKQRTAQQQAKAAEQTQQSLSEAQQKLQSEQAARAAAERRADQAMMKLQLSKAAAVKQEPEQTVVTIPGSLLFASNQAQLLPTANDKLDEIASALKEQNDRKIRIEGHTDSQGSSAYNVQLSKERADAVASFLISRGVPSANIATHGAGETRPVADNESAEGRANNRRVEIMVERIEPR